LHRAASFIFAAILLASFPASSARAQRSDQGMGNMPGMSMPGTETQPSHKAKKHKKKSHRHVPSATNAAPAQVESKPSTAGGTHGGSMGDMQGMGNMPGMEHKPSKGAAQNPPSGNMQAMEGMNAHDNMAGMNMTGVFGGYPMSRDASGTSWQPDLAEHHGIHAMLGDWMLMGHLMLYGIYDTQSGPRGDDKTFLAGMIMGMARRELTDSDLVSFRAMLSPEPFMGRRGYPLLLQTGETGNGVTPLVDRQHPHDLFMELSGTYDHKFSADDSAFLYFGYPGEPALGPPAFMHRASGMDDPAAPLTHHWLDSTHIEFGVATVGFVHENWKLEVSQFTGREPDQHRFDFDKPQFDSTSVRVSFNPDEHWALQGSWGHLHSPEQLAPLVNEDRFTASAIYVTRWNQESSFAATLAWGLKHLSNGVDLNGVLLESEYKPCDLWTLFARAEWQQNDEIVPGGLITRDGEISLGGIRDFQVSDHWKFGLGASYTLDFTPRAATPAYGGNPHGIMAFVRIAAQ